MIDDRIRGVNVGRWNSRVTMTGNGNSIRLKSRRKQRRRAAAPAHLIINNATSRAADGWLFAPSTLGRDWSLPPRCITATVFGRLSMDIVGIASV